MSPIGKYWKYLEDIAFIIVAAIILYGLVAGFSTSTWTSLMGKGYVADLMTPLQSKEYYKSVLALLSMATTFFILLELIKLIIVEWRKQQKDSTASASVSNKFSGLSQQILTRYKSNFSK